MTNDKALPSGWASWPTIVSVAQTLGMSQTEARRVLKDAGLQPLKVAKDNSTRFDPEAIEELAQSLAEDDAVGEKAVRKTVRQEYAEALRLQSDYIKSLQGHITQLTTLIPNMLEKATEILIAAGKRDGEQVQKLYDMRETMHQAREDALTQAAERDAIKSQTESQERRKTEAFGLLMKSLPRLMSQVETTIAAKMGGSKLKDAADLMASIGDAELAALLDEGLALLNAEQRDKLKKVLGTERLAAIEKLKESENASSK